MATRIRSRQTEVTLAGTPLYGAQISWNVDELTSQGVMVSGFLTHADAVAAAKAEAKKMGWKDDAADT